MLRNYLTIAYRNMLRHKVFSFINILSLAIGMAVCILILQYVNFELGYDTFHEKSKHIYRVSFESYKEGELESKSAKTYPAVGVTLKKDFPEVKDFSRLVILGEAIATHENVGVRESQIYLTDTSFFNLFSFPMIQGNAKTALAQPFTVLLSENVAAKIFGKNNPIDKTIQLHSNNLDGSATFTVKGIFKDIAQQSHIKPQILVSYPTLHEFIGPKVDNSWAWNNVYTYVLLHPESDSRSLEAKLTKLAATYNGKALQEANAQWKFFLQPLESIHLYSALLHEPEPNGSAKAVYFLLIVAILILLIAIVNYINLSTAHAIRRAKEVGIRKVSGAFRSQLFLQFITESLLINVLGITLAITIVQIFAGYFNQLMGIPSGFSMWKEFVFLPLLLGILFISAIISSIYPAFILSSFKAIKVLKGNLHYDIKDVLLRKGLIVFQFIASVVLIAGTLVAYQQLDYMLHKDLGINTKQILVIQAPKAPDANGSNWEIFKNELKTNSSIIQMAAANEIPGKEIYWRDNNISLPDKKPTATFTGPLVDIHYLNLLQVKIVSGRYFDKLLDNRDKSVIINEAAAQVLGFQKPSDAVLQKINIRNKTLDIVGVIKNFHQQSLKTAVEPMVFRYASDGYGFNYYLIKINLADKSPLLIGEIKANFDKIFPGNPFDYFFLDEFYNIQYKADQQIGKIFGLFSGFAIFVACLGLFGLASFATTQRTKEIGVRKVLGASVNNIIFLLSKDFMKLVLVSNLIAWPLAYWGVNTWLESYAFRIEVSVWFFILPSLLVCAIALLTTGIQTMKAAKTNPVKSLRYE